MKLFRLEMLMNYVIEVRKRIANGIYPEYCIYYQVKVVQVIMLEDVCWIVCSKNIVYIRFSLSCNKMTVSFYTFEINSSCSTQNL